MKPDTVRRIRTNAGLSQEEFGERLGISQDLVSKIELGKRRITKRTELQIQALKKQLEK